jgi:hypothetical protein
MRKMYSKVVLALCAFGFSTQVIAGNKDRSGQAGATELLINPWGASTGVFGMNTSHVKGIESFKTNIAGLAFVDKTELGLAYTSYPGGAKISVNNLGFAQKLGNAGVVGVNIMSWSFGDINITDYNNPEGGIGTYNPQFFNFSLGFAKEFSNHIHAGVAATFVSEQIASIKASGAAFEAGIQYVTGKRDNFHFGITLRNIGTNMRFSGSGFSANSANQEQPDFVINRQTPAEKFAMPTYLNLGVAYDFFLDEGHLKGEDDMPKHRATVMVNFTSNSFNNDYIGAGVEYSFREILMLRAAYRHEKNIGDASLSTTMFTGISAGASIQHRIGEKGPKLAIDYSHRPTRRPGGGMHTFSLRLMR